MNKVILVGRLTSDPDIRQTNNGTHVARYTLAVDRRVKREGEQNADFLPCTAFAAGADFAEKYLYKGMKILVCGRLQTGSYTNRDGQKVYTTDVIVEEHEFVEKKAAGPASDTPADSNGFMSVPEDYDDGLPFH